MHDVDKDQSGWNKLCEALTRSKIASFTAVDIGMGPVALRTLATSLPTTLTKIDICGAHIDEEVFASMKGVAPEGCEVLWQ